VSSMPYTDAVSPAFCNLIASPSPYFSEKPGSSCQKLLFSATLTHDPGKIAALELRNPKYFIVRESDGGVVDVVTDKFTMPSTLVVRFFPAVATCDRPNNLGTRNT
jgi:ATP-dependent RNA helicase DDX51/DBP6